MMVLGVDIYTGKQHIRHERHPDCSNPEITPNLPLDSCHWEGCAEGVAALDRLCFHAVEELHQ